jgi:hypothetical protein
MRIQRSALLKELSYKPNPDHYDSMIDDLEARLTSIHQENQILRRKLTDAEQEKIESIKKTEQTLRESASKDRAIVDLQNNVARLRNEVHFIENSKAPVQIIAFSLFILVIILLFT